MSSRTGVTGKSLPNTKSSSTGADQGALLKRALQWIVTDNMFADFKQHGNSSWKASSMVILVEKPLGTHNFLMIGARSPLIVGLCSPVDGGNEDQVAAAGEVRVEQPLDESSYPATDFNLNPKN
ncbi:MAG: hypothetical protein JNL67_20620 [Planctomycetaceae bacterium]|nr:hypothetical protein [Planctomycetaceae bacterium]